VKLDQIQRYTQWSQDHEEELGSIIGAARQFSNIAGVYLDPKGRWKKQNDVSFLKFSIRPWPLKWKGVNTWNRMAVIIKMEGKEITFCIMIDGVPMNVAPNTKWSQIRNAKAAIERTTKKINVS
jgi:hypothetical protein